jgi:DHA1 family multidrug resistance protein-like MFS transporter
MNLSSIDLTLDNRWLRTLIIMFFAQLMTAVGFSSIFPFLPLYVESLGTSTNLSIEFLAGLVYSAQAFTMMLASPIWGTLADRYGRKLMVERSMFGGSLIILLMAFVTSAEQLVFLRAIQGAITGTIAAANALIASIVPRQRTGFAMGSLQVGLGAGVAVGPLIGGLIADSYGYSFTFFITAALLFISGLTVFFGVHEQFIPQEGLKLGWRSFMTGWRAILSTAGVSVTYGMRFVSGLGRMIIIPVAPLFIQLLLPGSERVNTVTGLVVGSAAATTTISAVFLGVLGDRVGHRRILIGCAFVAALLYLPQSMVTDAWQLLLLQALVGVAIGGIIPSISALLYRYAQSGEAGAVYGLDNSINAAARAAAPLMGAAVAYWFSLRATFIATALLFLAMAILALWRLPKPKVGRSQWRSEGTPEPPVYSNHHNR